MTEHQLSKANLIGSKCLPDDKADEKVDDKADENVPYETPSDVDSSEPNPAEPKFKVGDKVIIIANMQTSRLRLVGRICR